MVNGSFIAVHRKWIWYQPVSYLSIMIRLFTKSYWNHTAVGLIIDGKEYAMESNHKGVVLETFERWKRKYGKKEYKIYDPIKDLPVNEFLKYIGLPYDYLSVFLWQPIYILTGLWLGKKGTKGSDKTYCTEIWSYAMGLKNAYKLTTADIVRCLTQ